MTPWSLLVYATFVVGGLAVYLLLPNTERSTKTAGAILGLAALAGAMAVCGRFFLTAGGLNAVFILSALVAIGSAVMVITQEKPVYSALYFVLVILAVVPLLLLQSAEFLAIALVIVYAGAILVTYMFVIMLSQQDHEPTYDRRARAPFQAVFAGFFSMAVIAGQLARLPEEQAAQGVLAAAPANAPRSDAPPIDNTQAIGESLIAQYLVGFELAGVLLLVAMIGAIALSRKRIPQVAHETPIKAPGQLGREAPPY
jgi:NADH-quinone oxidoreductase subunit J